MPCAQNGRWGVADRAFDRPIDRLRQALALSARERPDGMVAAFASQRRKKSYP